MTELADRSIFDFAVVLSDTFISLCHEFEFLHSIETNSIIGEPDLLLTLWISSLTLNVFGFGIQENPTLIFNYTVVCNASAYMCSSVLYHGAGARGVLFWAFEHMSDYWTVIQSPSKVNVRKNSPQTPSSLCRLQWQIKIKAVFASRYWHSSYPRGKGMTFSRPSSIGIIGGVKRHRSKSVTSSGGEPLWLPDLCSVAAVSCVVYKETLFYASIARTDHRLLSFSGVVSFMWHFRSVCNCAAQVLRVSKRIFFGFFFWHTLVIKGISDNLLSSCCLWCSDNKRLLMEVAWFWFDVSIDFLRSQSRAGRQKPGTCEMFVLVSNNPSGTFACRENCHRKSASGY